LNSLTGTIPSQIGDMTGLKSLGFSGNAPAQNSFHKSIDTTTSKTTK
jgi:hypothetical protein